MINEIGLNKIHPDLNFAKTFVYDACGFLFSNLIQESESNDYGACTFSINFSHIKFRVAKVTPTKTGLFVTLWKRDEAGITCPHDASDIIDFFVISVRNKNRFGQFVFPKEELLKQHVLSSDKKEGKRGFRVYPPWDKQLNKQAQKTQNWQLNFFLEIDAEKLVDVDRSKHLYAQN
ncbi:MepB family protein [Aurantibacillus circumpalustris]|uniref:MepB family protein n=1 Tax=Aurantibacillus circumpalustris TaxID=3036359 RepID=UPI00295AB130|nr:MepB family protein [Aurantibacillus circumpalustris]